MKDHNVWSYGTKNIIEMNKRIDHTEKISVRFWLYYIKDISKSIIFIHLRKYFAYTRNFNNNNRHKKNNKYNHPLQTQRYQERNISVPSPKHPTPKKKLKKTQINLESASARNNTKNPHMTRVKSGISTSAAYIIIITSVSNGQRSQRMARVSGCGRGDRSWGAPAFYYAVVETSTSPRIGSGVLKIHAA